MLSQWKQAGFDILNSLQFVGEYDATALQAGYYASALAADAKRDTAWKKVSTSAVGSMAWRTGNVLYNTMESKTIDFGGQSAYNGEWKICAFNPLFTSGGNELSSYVGKQAKENSSHSLVL